MKITINRKQKEHQKGITGIELAKKEKVKDVLAMLINNIPADLSTKISDDDEIKFLNFKDKEGKDIFWHSSAHILAQAIKKLFPKAKTTIGPAIESGFYYDFDDLEITPADFIKIEEEAKKIIKADYPFKRIDWTLADVKKNFPNNKYKLELAKEFVKEGDKLSAYKDGNFVDLCRGPHVPSTGFIKAFKVMKTSGAYWRADVKNKQLTRIYGISFPEQKELKQYLFQLQEAEKRDHKKLGKQLRLFSIHEEAPGMPFILPKGMIIWNELLKFWREEHTKAGYGEVKTPIMLGKELWEVSGHWKLYKDDMYTLKVDEKDYAVKPMNCPGGMLIYKEKTHSYKEFPLKLGEIGLVHRHEQSGELSGLLRVRVFHQDDAHIFMTETQIKDEVLDVLRLTDKIYKTFGFDYHVELSTRPEKSIGTAEQWDFTTNALKGALEEWGKEYQLNEGDGAFYGPKIDFHIKDALGRTWQCGTVQLDMSLPERFDLTYEGQDGKKHRPFMIHRTIYGSLERFLAVLIEHYAGKFPLWLSPVQIKILTVADRFVDQAKKIKKRFEKEGFRVEVDDRGESIGRKVREAQLEKINYMLVFGEKEEKSGKLNVRTRDNKVINDVDMKKFLKDLKEELDKKK